MSEYKTRVIRAVSVLMVALGAGFVMQNLQQPQAAPREARTEVGKEPQAIENLAAEPETVLAVTQPRQTVLAGAAVAVSTAASMTAVTPLPGPTKDAVGVQATAEAAMSAGPTAAIQAPVLPEMATPEAMVAAQAPESCPVTLDLIAEENAMVGLTLLAPCHPNERVVVKHAGLAVSGLTTANGALFTGIPALETPALVQVLFADGSLNDASIDIPEVGDLRRFAVQWQADDAFQLHAFENGAGYGGVGHVSGADPHRPAAGAPAKGGFLTLLGDSTTENPLLAEVYTYPGVVNASPDVVIEVAVTPATCGRELLGETLTSTAGNVSVTDLTVAMPECDAVGDYLVLKNLVPDMNIASAD